MNKKRISALALSLMLALSTAASAATFPDMPSDPQIAAAIENAVKNGLISGYDDGTVKPDNAIKRSEMAVIITQACKVTKEGNIARFTDVSKEDWFYPAMAKAYEMGAFSGDGNNMNPHNNITVQECFTVLSQVFDLIPPYTIPNPTPEKAAEGTYILKNRVYDVTNLNSFSDKADVANWAIPYVSGVVANGGWKGVDGKLIPTAYITRAQFASVMDNLIQNYIDEPGTYNELPEGNTMIRSDGVILENVTTDGDIYIGDSISPNGIEIKELDSKGRVVIRGCASPTVNDKGETTYGDTSITITGKVNTTRVIRPYINLNMGGVEYNTFHVAKYSHVKASLPATNTADTDKTEENKTEADKAETEDKAAEEK